MNIVSHILGKLVNPVSLYRIIKLQKGRKKFDRSRDDAQLKLYSRILEGDFLHYGYFDDPAIKAADISLNQIYRAQLRYAEMLIDQLDPTRQKVLDIGCGMGGLLKLMLDKGMSPEALTPDQTQITYIKGKYPGLKTHHCKFEELDGNAHAGKFEALITSESLQYLKLEKALPLLHQISTPDARWVACDYFRTGDKAERSGHFWEPFLKQVQEAGWELTYEQDITPNILPTIAYAYLWGSHIGLPLYEFGIEKLQVKAPGFYDALKEVLPEIRKKIDKNLLTVNPEVFAQNKRYKLLVFQKKQA